MGSGLGWVANQQISLADIFMGATVARVQFECPRVIGEGKIELAETAIRIGEQVIGVGIVRTGFDGLRKIFCGA